MMDKPENPLAFPSVETHPNYDMPMHHFGMTLRDWFAGQALAGMLANQRLLNATRDEEGADGTCEAVVRGAYGLADAMLAERSKP